MATKQPQSAPDEQIEEETGPNFVIGDETSRAFGLYGASIDAILKRHNNYLGPRQSFTVDSIHRKLSGAWDDVSPPAPSSADDAAIDAEPDEPADVTDDIITKPEAVDIKPAFAVATVQHDTTKLPDLTNAYLDQLIGWYRQKEGVNPRANAKHVWMKDKFEQWYKSPTETWLDINQAIVNRERNVETTAPHLADYIKNTRLNLTPARLCQLLDWYQEKTGKPHKKLQDVWLKDSGEWALANYRWSDIEREFIHPEVRAALGAETLQQFKQQRVTAAIDQLVMQQGQTLSVQPR